MQNIGVGRLHVQSTNAARAALLINMSVLALALDCSQGRGDLGSECGFGAKCADGLVCSEVEGRCEPVGRPSPSGTEAECVPTKLDCFDAGDSYVCTGDASPSQYGLSCSATPDAGTSGAYCCAWDAAPTD
jgi:hypothetical protein